MQRFPFPLGRPEDASCTFSLFITFCLLPPPFLTRPLSPFPVHMVSPALSVQAIDEPLTILKDVTIAFLRGLICVIGDPKLSV
jgi:hypothetical protein